MSKSYDVRKSKVPQLLATTNYDRFKIINSNREINRSHLKKLTRSIETKNLLYLFPLVINSDMEVVDGQHRLTAARNLGVPVYYLIDNSVTKADIAMMNSNRKSWAMMDYVLFHAKEGNKNFRMLAELLKEYPKMNINCGCRLMDENTTNYTQGGGYGNKIRTGNINSGTIVLARVVMALAKRLHKHGVEYAFNGFFLIDIKNAIVQSGMLAEQAADVIFKKREGFPGNDSFAAMQQLRLLKDMLGVKQFRPHSSREEVERFLEREAIK